MTSAYFLTFSLAQLPIGVALDRWGPRTTESTLLVSAAFGGLIFAVATSPSALVMGRGLIGLGVAACLMASFKSFVDWAPPDRIPALNGWVMACGSAGAIASTTPVIGASQIIGWRGVFGVLAAATLLLALVIWTCVPEPSGSRTSESLGDSVLGLARVFKSPLFWSITPLAVLHQSSYLAIQGLWAGPWLRDVAGLETRAVASHLFWLAVAMVTGYMSFGWLSQRLVTRGGSILGLLVTANVAFSGVLVWLGSLSPEHPRLAWIAFGFVGSAGMLSYVILTRRFASELSGRVTTALNLLTFLSAFAIQAGDRRRCPVPDSRRAVGRLVWPLGISLRLLDPGSGTDRLAHLVEAHRGLESADARKRLRYNRSYGEQTFPSARGVIRGFLSRLRFSSALCSSLPPCS